ncbi:MAG TPA: hypothetical protein PK257_00910 [Candidatus Woesebacteria bacterium]|nr:hypothetical protein [Candidatus Woesebacteria bacterium]
MRERFILAEGQISFDDIGDPDWRNKIGRMTHKKMELLSLREKEFWKIYGIKKEMEERGDERTLFLIRRGTEIASKEKNLFKGDLSKRDVLAFESKDYLEIRPLFSKDKIVINYFDPKIGERVRKPIEQFQIQKEGVDRLNLMEIKNEEQFWKAMKPNK